MNLDMDSHRWRHDSGLSLVGFSFMVFLLIVAVFVMFAFLASVTGCASGESPQVAAVAARVDKIETRVTGVEALRIGGNGDSITAWLLVIGDRLGVITTTILTYVYIVRPAAYKLGFRKRRT